MIRQMSHDKEKAGKSLVYTKGRRTTENGKSKMATDGPHSHPGSRRGDRTQQGHEQLTFLIL